MQPFLKFLIPKIEEKTIWSKYRFLSDRRKLTLKEFLYPRLAWDLLGYRAATQREV